MSYALVQKDEFMDGVAERVVGMASLTAEHLLLRGLEVQFSGL